MNKTIFAILITLIAGSAWAQEGKRLPIVTGNFSVSWIQHSPVGAFPDPDFPAVGGIPSGRRDNWEPVPPADNWAGHHKVGIKAYEDYVAWGGVEREPGKWDWSRQIEVADNQRAGGLEYDPYLWIHNPPMWMREGKLPNEPDSPGHYTVMRCLEHDEPTQTFSIWDPATVKWFERYYREMHKGMGDKIGRTYVGLVGPFGEGNYPLPIFDYLKIGHCHEGYWCGDAYARRAFMQTMKKRYVTLAKLNSAWGTEFGKWEDVGFPPEISDGKILPADKRTDPKARRMWVDFIQWYHQSMIDFSAQVTKAALKYFPIEKLKMKPGGSAGGVNPIAWGTYCPGYAKALSGLKVRLQPADCSGHPFGDRWYGSAYRFYGIPFTTEPAGGLSERDFRRRVFMDACNGTTEMFSYEWDKHKDDGLKWIHLYRGVPSITDVAVYCPTTWYRMNGDIWPAIRAADELRDITDFEVADEILIKDDYLAKRKIRVLIWLQGPVVERSALEKVVKWVEGGGILIANAPVAPTDVEGRTNLGLKLFPPVNQDKPMLVTHKLGKGLVIQDPLPTMLPRFKRLVREAVYHPEKLKPDLRGAAELDSEFDGIWTAVFPDMLLFYNTSDKATDFSKTWKGQEIKVHLEAGELGEVKR